MYISYTRPLARFGSNDRVGAAFPRCHPLPEPGHGGGVIFQRGGDPLLNVDMLDKLRAVLKTMCPSRRKNPPRITFALSSEHNAKARRGDGTAVG